MRHYETIFIIRPNLSEDEITTIIDRTKKIIEGDGGSLVKTDKWGLKKLAYLIKKEQQGYYVYIEYEGVPATVNELERISKIDDNILKYLTVKLHDVYIPVSVEETPEEDEAAETEDAPAAAGAEAESESAEAKPESAEAEPKDAEAAV